MQTHLHSIVYKATPIAPQAEWLSELLDHLPRAPAAGDRTDWLPTLCTFKFFKKGSLHWAWSPSLNTLWVFLLLPLQVAQEKPTSPIRSLYLHNNESPSAQFLQGLNPKTARRLHAWLQRSSWSFPLLTPTTASLVKNLNRLQLKLPSDTLQLCTSDYYGPTNSNKAHLPLLISALITALNTPSKPNTSLTKCQRRSNMPTTTTHLPTQLERWKRCGKSLRTNTALIARYHNEPWAGYRVCGDFKTFNPKNAANYRGRRWSGHDEREKDKIALALEWQLALDDDSFP